jgi:hypothetical protein
LFLGQRYDVIFNASQPIGNYWLRVGTGGGRCDGPNINAANIRSIFRYAGAEVADPTDFGNFTLPTGCYDEDFEPWVKLNVPQKTPQQLEVGFTNTAFNSNVVQWLIDGTPMLVDLEKPTLQDVFEGNDTFSPGEHVFVVPKDEEVSAQPMHAANERS